MRCRLCKNPTRSFFTEKERVFLCCEGCGAIQLHSSAFLSPQKEKERYLKHHNDVKDPGYQKFVTPITRAILRDYSPAHLGLDFGCGTGPVVTRLLERRNFQIRLFDPFFYWDPKVLKLTYDYIICCEVMEHFHHPKKEFQRLSNLLKPGGRLYCKTSLFSADIDFGHWYYKNDSSHVFFYTAKSLEWIRTAFGFTRLTHHPEFLVFEK